MSRSPKTAELIRERIERMRRGEPFTPKAFVDCGTRASVDQTLSRLAEAGTIERIARGVFARPKFNRYVGRVAPDFLTVAKAVANASGAVVQIHGAEAARRLGLTTQMQVQPVFITSGPSRRIHVGKTKIRLLHVCPRKLILGDRPAGLALTAMWYLGKEEVTPELIGKIHRKLGESEYEALKSTRSSMPAWMNDAIQRYEQMTVH